MKVSTLIWFLKHPGYLPQAFQVLRRRLSVKGDNWGVEDATEWCQQVALLEDEVQDRLLGISHNEPFRDLFPEYLKYAEKQAADSPVTMGGKGGINLLYSIVANRVEVCKVLETGVAYGWSSLAILLALKDRKGGHLYSVDMPYVGLNNEAFVGTVVHPDLKDRWTLIRKPDRAGIPQVLGMEEFLDLIHYDSDKSYSGRKWAYPILWKALRDGGLFISDDIQDNLGFKEFCDDYVLDPLVYKHEGKFVGVLVKS